MPITSFTYQVTPHWRRLPSSWAFPQCLSGEPSCEVDSRTWVLGLWPCVGCDNSTLVDPFAREGRGWPIVESRRRKKKKHSHHHPVVEFRWWCALVWWWRTIWAQAKPQRSKIWGSVPGGGRVARARCPRSSVEAGQKCKDNTKRKENVMTVTGVSWSSSCVQSLMSFPRLSSVFLVWLISSI